MIILVLVGTYIIYLNFLVFDLKKNLDLKDEIYKIQINNRINELNQLNIQLDDLQKLLDIGLDLSKKKPLLNKNKAEITIEDKVRLLKSIPNGSPLKKVFITSSFGDRIHPISKVKTFHTGIDFRAKIGTKIYATSNGIAYQARDYDPGGYGKKIVLSHNYGFQTIFAHLDKVFIKKGDVVKKGDLIGLSGNTGISTAPHLHYEVKFIGGHLNPLSFVYLNKKTFNTITNKKRTIDLKKFIALEKRNYIKEGFK